MSYENPNRISYLWPSQDAGAGTVTKTIIGPNGKRGRVWDYGVLNVTEAFTADTLPSSITVGKSGDLDAYGTALSMGTLATGGGKTLRSTFDAVAAEPYTTASIDADTPLVLTMSAPTGGTPAGIGDLFLVIDWDD